MPKFIYILRFLIGLPFLTYACLSMMGGHNVEKSDLARASLIQSAQPFSVTSASVGSEGVNSPPVNQLVHVQGRLNGTESFDPLTHASIPAAHASRSVQTPVKENRRGPLNSVRYFVRWDRVSEDDLPAELLSEQKITQALIEVDGISLPHTSVSHLRRRSVDEPVYKLLHTGSFHKLTSKKTVRTGETVVVYSGVRFGIPITAVGTLVASMDTETKDGVPNYILQGRIGNTDLELDRVVVAPGYLSVEAMGLYYVNTFARKATDFKFLYLAVLFMAMMLMLTPIATVPGIRGISLVKKYRDWRPMKRCLAQFGVALCIVILVSLLDRLLISV